VFYADYQCSFYKYNFPFDASDLMRVSFVLESHALNLDNSCVLSLQASILTFDIVCSSCKETTNL
jgi:hypothetical protein